MKDKKRVKAETLWLSLWRTYHALLKVDEESIAKTGLCRSDFAILEALLHKGSLSVQEVARVVLLTSGSMTTAANRLIKKDYIQRKQQTEDKRVYVLSLTKKGNKVIQEAFPKHAERLEKAMSGLGSKERNTLLKLLQRLKRSASHEAHS